MCVKFGYMSWASHVSDCSDFVPVLVSSPVKVLLQWKMSVSFSSRFWFNLPWARMHHADYYHSIFKISPLFWMMISRLNCPPLPNHVPVELHWESWVEKENSAIYSRVSFCNVWTQVISMEHELSEVSCCCPYQIGWVQLHKKWARE